MKVYPPKNGTEYHGTVSEHPSFFSLTEAKKPFLCDKTIVLTLTNRHVECPMFSYYVHVDVLATIK